MSCRCGDKGLLRIRYESGEPDDLAICTCRHGQYYRATYARHPEVFTAWWPDVSYVGLIEEFEDDPVPAVEAEDESFLAAGRTMKPPRL